MNLSQLIETHNGQSVVNGMDFTKALAKTAGIDPMRAWLLVGTAANMLGAEVLCTGPKGDRSAYRLEDASEIADRVLAAL